MGFRFHIAAVPGVLQLNSELLLFNVNPSEASCAAGAGGGLRSGAGAGRGVGAQSLALLPWSLLNDRYRYIYIYLSCRTLGAPGPCDFYVGFGSVSSKCYQLVCGAAGCWVTRLWFWGGFSFFFWRVRGDLWKIAPWFILDGM